MRPDQRERLAAVSERLAEVVIRDCDPDNWTAGGKTIGQMTRDERGDAAWCRKTAVQSVALLVRVETLLAPAGDGKPGELEPDPEDQIARAEKGAAELLKKLGIGEAAPR